MVIIDPERRELQAVLDRLPDVPRCRVLEIGCGDGRLTRRYAPRVGPVLAIDPDAALVAAFRGEGVDANVEVRAAAVDALDLPDRAFDVVLFSWAL